MEAKIPRYSGDAVSLSGFCFPKLPWGRRFAIFSEQATPRSEINVGHHHPLGFNNFITNSRPVEHVLLHSLSSWGAVLPRFLHQLDNFFWSTLRKKFRRGSPNGNTDASDKFKLIPLSRSEKRWQSSAQFSGEFPSTDHNILLHRERLNIGGVPR